MGLGRVTSNLVIHSNLHQTYVEAPLVLGQATGDFELQNSAQPGLGGRHHLPPYSILCTSSLRLRPNDCLSQDFRREVLKLLRLDSRNFARL